MDYNWFNKIYNEHKAIVYSVARQYAYDNDACEDMFQEAWMNIYKSIDSYKSKSKISTWIFGVARNCALSYNKKIKVFPTDKIQNESDSGFEKNLLDKIDIRDAMEKLSADEQLIIYLRYTMNYNYIEISEKMDLSEKIIKSRLFETRKKMRKILKKD